MQGYRQSRAYIVTQWPMKSTIRDFWRLVSDYKMSTIVLVDDCKPCQVCGLKCAELPDWFHFKLKQTLQHDYRNDVDVASFTYRLYCQGECLDNITQFYSSTTLDS